MVTIDKSFIMNHTCLRIKDPKVSVPFYEKNFGMQLVRTLEFDGFSLYMMSFETPKKTGLNWSGREGILELCHNHGAENDDNYKVNSGNGETFRGFGHICFSVDNIEYVESKLLDNGAKFQKKLSDGRQKNIAFVLDPDGYWIELIEHGRSKVENQTNQSDYKFNHSMIRVKDPKKSLDFYCNKLGFKLLKTKPFEGAKFTLYFLGYDHENKLVENDVDPKEQSYLESLIELTHNWGTEDDESFSYHNGNSTENGAIQGFGHTCISCDDPVKFCNELTEAYGDELDWSVEIGKANISPDLAFIRDPDGYSVEIISTKIFQ